MKEKAIFIISIILVVLGVSYLGYTAYKFFTRDTANGGGNGGNKEQVEGDISSIALTTASNQELLGENKQIGEDLTLSASLKNDSEDMIATNFEGRSYKIDELFTFPNVDTELPVDSKQVNVTLNGSETKEFTYTFTPNACGTYYMALADENYWSKGRGTITYGYATVSCDSSSTDQDPSTGTGETEDSTTNTSGGLTPVDNTGTGNAVVGTVNGTTDSTKGGTTGSAQVTPTPTTKGGQDISELPKSGPEHYMLGFGVLSILSAFAYRLKKINVPA